MATVFIAGLTMGAGAMVAGAGRFGAFVRLIQFADEMGSIGTYISKVKSKVRLPKGLGEELRRALKPAPRAHGGGPHGHGAGQELLRGNKPSVEGLHPEPPHVDGPNVEPSRVEFPKGRQSGPDAGTRPERELAVATAKTEVASPHSREKSGHPVKLNRRQQAIADKLPNQGSMYTFAKKEVSMADLRELTRATGDEYSMYTQRATNTEGAKRLVIRGHGNEIRVTSDQFAAELRAGKHGKWSGHTHPPGYLGEPGPADRPNIPIIQERSAIWSDDPVEVFHRTPHEDEIFEETKRRAEFRRLYGE